MDKIIIRLTHTRNNISCGPILYNYMVKGIITNNRFAVNPAAISKV